MPDYLHLLDPLLTWIRILIGCAVLLLAEALLIFVITSIRRRSWWLRLSALAPLAAGIGAALAQQHLYDIYLSWMPLAEFEAAYGEPNDVTDPVYSVVAQAINDATRLGWLVVIVTVLLLALGLLGFARLVLSERRSRGSLQPLGTGVAL